MVYNLIILLNQLNGPLKSGLGSGAHQLLTMKVQYIALHGKEYQYPLKDYIVLHCAETHHIMWLFCGSLCGTMVCDK